MCFLRKQSYSPPETEKLSCNCGIMDVEQRADFGALFLRHYKPLTCFIRLSCILYMSRMPNRKRVFLLYVNVCKQHVVIFKNGSVTLSHAIFMTSNFLLVIERVLFKDSSKF